MNVGVYTREFGVKEAMFEEENGVAELNNCILYRVFLVGEK